MLIIRLASVYTIYYIKLCNKEEVITLHYYISYELIFRFFIKLKINL